MNNFVIFSIALLIVCIFCLQAPKKEKFVEIFAGSGYEKPKDTIDIDFNANVDESAFVLQDSGINNNEIRECVIPTINFIKKETGLCTVPIETNKVELFKSPDGVKLYKCRFMMMVKDVGFPFGFGISVDVMNGQIIFARTETVTSGADLEGIDSLGSLGENFLPASDLLPKPKSL